MLPSRLAPIVALGLSAAARADGPAYTTVHQDTHVVSSAPATSHGAEPELASGVRTDGSVHRAFLRFTLPRLAGGHQIVSATLRGRFAGGAPPSYTASGVQELRFVADGDWNAASLTWSDQPAASTSRRSCASRPPPST